MDRPGLPSRRRVLQGAGALALASAALELAVPLARVPDRTAAAATRPDIQFDVASLLAAPQTAGAGVTVQMPPVHTVFVTGRLECIPTAADQAMLASALARLEAVYPFNAANLLTFVSYGIPYFSRLPGGLAGRLVSSRMRHGHRGLRAWGGWDVRAACPVRVPRPGNRAGPRRPVRQRGGPAFLPNANRGTGHARRTAQGIGTNFDFRTGQREHRMEHLSCLQRSSRAADGTPVNFLCPPRRHRAFPLAELT